MAVIDGGNNSAGKANVDDLFNLQVNTPGFSSLGVSEQGGNNEAGAVAFLSENDTGELTGERKVLSPETDEDYRLRVAHDNLLDQECFNYTVQNTGKHSHTFTTLTATVSAAGLLTNSGSGVATNTGMTFGTFAVFPVGGTQTTVCETTLAFGAQPNANTIIDFGLFQRGATTAFAPLDGVYFRMNSAGLQGIVNSNGSETSTGIFPLALGAGVWAYTNNTNYRFLIQVNNVSTTFWIDNFLVGTIVTPDAANFPSKSVSLPWSVRHAIVGGSAGAVTQALITDYRVLVRGPMYSDDLGNVGNRVFGSYQALSGASPGSLANYANSTNPGAAVPTNTTAALGTGLGGQFWETFTLAITPIDGIICSYLNPASTAAVQGRRLRINGVSLMSYVQTVLAGGPQIRQFHLAFGHTALSLATGESASFATGTAKAPRRVALPAFTQAVTATQAVSTMVSQPGGPSIQWLNPIYVNPGEYVALVMKAVGTVGSAGTIAHVVGFDYSWE
jgi:hypothetical protein